MPASKIQDEGEVIRWFEEGRTYDWMIQEYRRKYNIETVSSMWGNFRRRRGLPRRNVRDDKLIPWAVKPEHRYRNPVLMLRAVARQRAGHELDPELARNVETWLTSLAESDAVVHYEPDSEKGFYYVPRREGIDLDLIREPERRTTQRRNADNED